MIYDDIDALIDAIKDEKWYQDYVMAYQQAANDPELSLQLKTMQRLLEEREEQKKYSRYISLKDIDDAITRQRTVLSSYPAYTDYQKALYTLNKHLDEISHLIFDGISVNLSVGRLGKLYARRSR